MFVLNWNSISKAVFIIILIWILSSVFIFFSSYYLTCFRFSSFSYRSSFNTNTVVCICSHKHMCCNVQINRLINTNKCYHRQKKTFLKHPLYCMEQKTTVIRISFNHTLGMLKREWTVRVSCKREKWKRRDHRKVDCL